MTGLPSSLSIALWFTGSIWVVGILAYAFDAPVEVVPATVVIGLVGGIAEVAHSQRSPTLKSLLMLPAVIVFIGCGIGGAARHLLNGWVIRTAATQFPLGILLINVLGSSQA